MEYPCTDNNEINNQQSFLNKYYYITDTKIHGWCHVDSCGNLTMWPWKVHILSSLQCWRRVGAMPQYQRRENVMNLTLRLRCIDITIITSKICMRQLRYNFEATSLQLSEFDVVVSTLSRWCELDKGFQHSNNLPSKVKATLEQHYNFDVVASTYLQGCVLVVWRC